MGGDNHHGRCSERRTFQKRATVGGRAASTPAGQRIGHCDHLTVQRREKDKRKTSLRSFSASLRLTRAFYRSSSLRTNFQFSGVKFHRIVAPFQTVPNLRSPMKWRQMRSGMLAFGRRPPSSLGVRLGFPNEPDTPSLRKEVVDRVGLRVQFPITQ
ncbi:hypothetical protein RISK_002099 [Rhodopirellula islandica]|uniref:Uncharacterized protein n=1 Tax=Rhodopirellula islandica TaxID=595434 RepID=A0A0J1BFY9_RHOIS|nr:hypothetical protein RISK_002099 [Rhodopirellula islandica]